MDPGTVREILARAEAIQAGQSLALEDPIEVEGLVSAAAEAGLSREAVVQALRERLSLTAPLVAGELAFARSADGSSYVAKVEEASGHRARVRFLRGGQAEVSQSELVRFAPSPGLQLQAHYKDWGWWNSTVLGYNEDANTLTVSDGLGSEYTFSTSEVRLPRPRSAREVAFQRYLVGGLLFLAGCGIGALVVRLLTS